MASVLNASHVEWRMSGGATNTIGNNSLGGIMSSQEVFGQDATYDGGGIGGVTLRRHFGLAADEFGNSGTLQYTNASNILTWDPPGLGGPTGNSGALANDGKYIVYAGAGAIALVVDVVTASLPVGDTSDTVAIDTIVNELYDDISAAEAFVGMTDYRCVYVTNVHPTDPVLAVKVWIVSQPTGADSLEIGLDPAGVGDGSTTGVATTIGDEETAPAGVTFSSPATPGAGLTISGLAAGDAQAIWIKRTIPGGTTTEELEDVSTLGVQVAF